MNYLVKDDFITVAKSFSDRLDLRVTNASGCVIDREKIDTIIGIRHPGIILGVDENNTMWVVHHHFKNRYPAIETIQQFAQGQPVYLVRSVIPHLQKTILQRALRYCSLKPVYDPLTQNCQHFVNWVITNQKTSDTIDEIAQNVFLGGALLAIIGAANKDKETLQKGLLFSGAALALKSISSGSWAKV